MPDSLSPAVDRLAVCREVGRQGLEKPGLPGGGPAMDSHIQTLVEEILS
ncbi:MAG: hypothetical protein Q4C45_05750 [Oscillospiraceae bacterium]|nr:hypothetical protein [Oscillospiraceae bacterium]